MLKVKEPNRIGFIQDLPIAFEEKLAVIIKYRTNILKPTSQNTFVPKTAEVFSYDADGNLTGDGRWIYEWNVENGVRGRSGPRGV